MRVLRPRRPRAASRLAPRAGLAALVLAALVIGTRGTQDAVANGDTRTLTLYHNHTKETLTVTFRRNGQYDPRALEQLNWFLRDWRLDEPTRMDPRLFDVIWAVYREVGSDAPIHVNSAYRSARTNAMLRRRSKAVAKTSQHMRGKAMDFYLPDVPIERVRAIGMRLQEGGVGYYPSAYTPFVHLDVGSVRAWPRMTRDQLARIFPDGKTVHIPTDGEPLPRYEEARAEILARGGTVAGATMVAEDEGGAAPAKSRKGFWATLFGWSDEDEDADEVRTVRGREVYVARRAPPPNIYGGRERDSVYAALEPPQPAPQPVRVAARPAPPPPPAEMEPVVAALQRPVDEPRPAVPPTRIADLPATIETPMGPRLTWQQGPAGQPTLPRGDADAFRQLALAPMPPPRPEDPVTTGALAFAPLPPSRPSALSVEAPIAAPETVALRGPAAPVPAPALQAQGIDHPPPPRRPGGLPAAPVAVAAAIPVAAASAQPQSGARDEAPSEDRAQLRRLFGAPAPATPSAIPAPLAAPRPAAIVPRAVLSASPTLATGFSKTPMEDLATSRFTGSALKPLPVVR